MLAYHNDPKLKEDFLTLLKWHQDMDKIERGSYSAKVVPPWHTDDVEFTVNGWKFNSFGRGCAVGCSIESMRIINGLGLVDDKSAVDLWGNHFLYEKYIGVPSHLAYVEDILFERMPYEESMKWPVLFAESIKVGSDLSMVFPKFAVATLTDQEFGLGNKTVLSLMEPEDRGARKQLVNCLMMHVAGKPYVLKNRIHYWSDLSELWSITNYLEDTTDGRCGRFIDSLINTVGHRVLDTTNAQVALYYAKKLIDLIKAAPVPELQVNS